MGTKIMRDLRERFAANQDTVEQMETNPGVLPPIGVCPECHGAGQTCYPNPDHEGFFACSYGDDIIVGRVPAPDESPILTPPAVRTPHAELRDTQELIRNITAPSREQQRVLGDLQDLIEVTPHSDPEPEADAAQAEPT